jgi:UDP-N-acetyl-D-mannosaminuronate dehydrogenase
MNTYEILNADQNVINTIVATEEFVAANYSFYRKLTPPQEEPISKEVSEKQWRDSQLSATDWIVPVTDHSKYQEYLTYRQALRDWPSTVNFPDTRPVAP